MLSRSCVYRRWILRSHHHETAILPHRRIAGPALRWKSGGGGLLPPMPKPDPIKVSNTVSLLPPSGRKAIFPKRNESPKEGPVIAHALIPYGAKAKAFDFHPKKSTPRNQINNWYQPLKPVTRSDFTVTVVADPKDAARQWYTATFTCPVTGELVDAGTLRKSEYHRLKFRDIKVMEGRVYYPAENIAIHAASGRMMDAIQFIATGNTEPRNCDEDPSSLLLNVRPKSQEEEQVERVEQVEQLPSAEELSGKCPRLTLHNLYQKVMAVHNFSGFIDCFQITGPRSQVTATFTCPITGAVVNAGTMRGDDWEKKAVIDGKVCYRREKDAMRAAAARFLDDLQFTQTGATEPRFCQEVPRLIEKNDIEKLLRARGGSSLYSNNQVAEKPVDAGRPDNMFLSTTTLLAPVDVKDADDESDSQSVHVSPSDKSQSSKGQFLVMPPRSSFDFVVKDPADETASPVTLSLRSQEAESDEEFTIQNLSGFKISGTSTLERVMEAWGESVLAPKSRFEASDASYKGAPMQATPAQQKERVIADTIAWCNRLKKQEQDKGYGVFQTTTLPVTVRSANAALRALAKAHRSLPSEDQQSNQRVEAAAKQMVDFMWTADSTDIEVYNSYLLCLGRSSPTEAAQAAEEILRSMIERREVNGRLLPEPNIRTFNAVIQLWAVAGGSIGLTKCEEIFDMIQQESRKGIDIKPNRDTFLSVISSFARPSSDEEATTFERERAQQWIERMRTMGDETHDDTLVPDTQVFNAPLRWSGGMESTRSRPFTQGLAWDRYDDIFRDGFRPLQEDDPLRIEARRIEEWLLEMETIGPAPDVDTFEAALQAWTRTGMADGLRRAELVALRAIASDKIRSRLQTFHPILAAWALSGDERGPGKVQEWYERLKEKSATFPEMKPDARIHTCIMIAKRTHQKRLLASIDETADTVHPNSEADTTSEHAEVSDQNDDAGPTSANADSIDQNNEAVTKATEIASSCTDELSRMLDHFLLQRSGSADIDGLVMEPAIFSHVQSAWGDVAIAKAKALPPGGKWWEAIKPELQAMQQTVRKFDEAIQLLRSKQAANHAHSDEQLRQFLHHAQTVYLNALSYMNELDRHGQKVNVDEAESSLFYQYFYEAESMLRRAEELRNVIYSHSSSKDADGGVVVPEENNLVYDDLFVYSSDISDAGSDKSYVEKQIALYSEIVDGCQQIKSSPDYFSESARLCMLIVDFLDTFPVPPAARTVDCTELYLGILSVVENVPNISERYEILRRVLSSVKSISETARRDQGTLTVDIDSVVKQIKGEGGGESAPIAVGDSSNRKKPTRARRVVKRQRWRTAA